MRRSGHYEFGLDRRSINLGDADLVGRFQETLASGDDVRGLALYWNMVYDYLWRLLQSDPAVRRASRVVRFEDVAISPEETLCAALRHCELPEAAEVAKRHAVRIRRPTSDRSVFSARELAVIGELTGATAALWGYG
jgi:hypothetical protein